MESENQTIYHINKWTAHKQATDERKKLVDKWIIFIDVYLCGGRKIHL